MRFEIKLRIVTGDGDVIDDHEVLTLDKGDSPLEAVGLSLAEAKQLLGRLQQQLVAAQARSFVDRHRHCAVCRRPLRRKGRCSLVFRVPSAM